MTVVRIPYRCGVADGRGRPHRKLLGHAVQRDWEITVEAEPGVFIILDPTEEYYKVDCPKHTGLTLQVKDDLVRRFSARPVPTEILLHR